MIRTRDGQVVKYAIVAGPDGLSAYQASSFIDATGNGDLAARSGAEYEVGDEEGRMAPGTLCSMWHKVDYKTYREAKIDIPELLALVKQAIADGGIFSVPDLHHTGMTATHDGMTVGNISHVFGVDPTDVESLSAAMIFGRSQLLEYQKFYRKYVPGFAEAELVTTGALPGIRESRRIIGDYILNIEDFNRRAVFADEIGRFAYGVDLHPIDASLEAFERFQQEFIVNDRYKPGESYGIPFAALTVRNLKNILTCGRCISADRQMEGSVRTMPGCFITGQAAGIAAALAALENQGEIRKVSVEKIRQILRERGAFLPN